MRFAVNFGYNYLRLKLEEKGKKRLVHTIRDLGYALRE
jgi:DNA-binding response OmpR family regulator